MFCSIENNVNVCCYQILESLLTVKYFTSSEESKTCLKVSEFHTELLGVEVPYLNYQRLFIKMHLDDKCFTFPT